MVEGKHLVIVGVIAVILGLAMPATTTDTVKECADGTGSPCAETLVTKEVQRDVEIKMPTLVGGLVLVTIGMTLED